MGQVKSRPMIFKIKLMFKHILLARKGFQEEANRIIGSILLLYSNKQKYYLSYEFEEEMDACIIKGSANTHKSTLHHRVKSLDHKTNTVFLSP